MLNVSLVFFGKPVEALISETNFFFLLLKFVFVMRAENSEFIQTYKPTFSVSFSDTSSKNAEFGFASDDVELVWLGLSD